MLLYDKIIATKWILLLKPLKGQMKDEHCLKNDFIQKYTHKHTNQCDYGFDCYSEFSYSQQHYSNIITFSYNL
jgi:hypothetical protein